jgi:anthranilate synthase/aminodeoxychorismate synthase-like glutamine amidotransferase
MIDNYDSFTYNLVQYCGELGAELEVVRNDAFNLKELEEKKPEKIIISPGPGGPQAAGMSVELIKAFAGKIPILGVCLGHQCIGYAYGAKIIRARNIMHGKTSLIQHKGKGIFKGVPNPFEATRYHSLLVDKASLPRCFEILATTAQNEIMGMRHRKYSLWGVQFHPESILTRSGMSLLENFIRMKK